MLLKYFNSNRISVILLISILPVVYWMPSFFQGATMQMPEAAGVPFGRGIIFLNQNFRLISSFFALLLIIVNGNLLIQLNTVHIFIPVRTQLPSLFYVILVIGMNQLHQLTPALVSSSLLILVFYRIFSAYKTEGISIGFLDSGLLISMASLIYFPALVFFFFLLISMIILRPFIWREWIFALLGLVLPYGLIIAVYYLADIPIAGFFKDISGSLIKAGPVINLSHIVNWSYVLLFMLVSSYFIAIAFDNMKIHARKFFLSFLVFFLFSVLIFLVIPGIRTGIVYFVSVPLAYLFSNYFSRCRRNWINEIFFAIFILLLLWQWIN